MLKLLTEWFGYTHVLQVSSGGRGVHTIVCDERVWTYTDEQRMAIKDRLLQLAKEEFPGSNLKLDENVTNVSHLSGLPLCPHSKTGRLRHLIGQEQVPIKRQAQQFMRKRKHQDQ